MRGDAGSELAVEASGVVRSSCHGWADRNGRQRRSGYCSVRTAHGPAGNRPHRRAARHELASQLQESLRRGFPLRTSNTIAPNRIVRSQLTPPGRGSFKPVPPSASSNALISHTFNNRTKSGMVRLCQRKPATRHGKRPRLALRPVSGGSDEWPRRPAFCGIPAVRRAPKKNVPTGRVGGGKAIRTIGSIVASEVLSLARRRLPSSAGSTRRCFGRSSPARPTGADGECDRRARRRIAEPACRTHAEAFSLSKLFLLRWLRFLVAQDLCQS
jgi:hypothetical protein